MTIEQAKKKIVRRILPKYIEQISWSVVVSAVQSSSPQQRTSIATALSDGKAGLAGKILWEIVEAYVKTQAEAEADSILADNVISVEEFNDIVK